ncbi:DNA (cytosine-5-)-methyltransferase [Leptospira biflexa]|nr:DNA (cytosine-5-)-methyltransferase [Leptospira biflexa]
MKVASLFSGCGGTEVGLQGGFTFLGTQIPKLPTELVYANEVDLKTCDIFDLNFDKKVDRRDIRDVNEAEIPGHDLLVAGFPCQSFSILAQNPPRLGFTDEKGKLFFEIVRVLKYHHPKYFICENVKGILSANNGKTFPLILKEFEDAGYRVSFKLLNSRNFGVPQKRERVFIVGVRNDLKRFFIFPSKSSLFPLENNLGKVLENQVDDKYFFSEKAILGMLSSNSNSKAKMNKGRVQNLNEPCNTVTAHLSKVTLNGTDPVLKIGEKYRRFTPREVARIQSFPDSFKLIGSDFTQYKALGNAIPPLLFWHLAKEICTFEGKNKTHGDKEFFDLVEVSAGEQLTLRF